MESNLRMMQKNLPSEEFNRIKDSYLNIFRLFAKEEGAKKEHLDCVFQWGIQLGIEDKELDMVAQADTKFVKPREMTVALENLFDLVYMIYLDELVEDVELEVAIYYATQLGFEAHVVGDIVKAIVTAPGDGVSQSQVREDLKPLLEEAGSFK